jgi:hypothetical protein
VGVGVGESLGGRGDRPELRRRCVIVVLVGGSVVGEDAAKLGNAHGIPAVVWWGRHLHKMRRVCDGRLSCLCKGMVEEKSGRWMTLVEVDENAAQVGEGGRGFALPRWRALCWLHKMLRNGPRDAGANTSDAVSAKSPDHPRP